MAIIKPSISNYVISFLSSLVVLLVIYFSIILYFKNQENTDTTLINVSGRNRMLSQKIAFEAERLVRGDKLARKPLEQAIATYKVSLEVLKNGGTAIGFLDQGELPSIPSSLMGKYNKIVSAGKPFLEKVNSILTNVNSDGSIDDVESINSALNYIEQNADDLLKLNNDLVQGYLEICEQRKSNFIYALVSISLFVLIFFAFSYYMLKTRILDVLKQISLTAHDVADGNFNKSLPTQKDPYLSKITDAINDLGVNINQAAQFATTIGEGNFEYEFNSVRGGNKLFIELGKMRDQLKLVAEEDKRRNWTSTGLALFADILRNDKKSIHELGNKIISECVKYLNANQGSLFILSDDEEEEYMELLSTYAWERQKHLQKKLRKGETLIGQSWIEKSTIYINEIPEKYVTITSGLGEANPRELLIVPLVTNEEIYGIIEIASFHKFEQYHIDFMEKLGENIASSLSSAHTMRQTESLLIKSQQQSEELGAQEEEIRQNMEEMTATQEQMTRNEEDNLKRIKELEEQLAAQSDS